MFVLQKRMEDLRKERKKVQDQIAMAEDQLKDTKDLLRMLDDSKTVSTQTSHDNTSGFPFYEILIVGHKRL